MLAQQPGNCFTCRTSRQGSCAAVSLPVLAGELVHLPDKPAGVQEPPELPKRTAGYTHLKLLSRSRLALLLLALLPAFASGQTLKYEQPVHALAYTPDGRSLLIAGDDGLIRVWDVRAGKEARLWAAHERGVTTLALTADGKTLASGGRDGKVRLWDLARGVETGVFEGIGGDVEGLTLSADGKVIAASGTSRSGFFRTGRNRLWCG